MLMLGIVRTHLMKMVTWLKNRLLALILTLKSPLEIFGAYLIGRMIQCAINIKLTFVLILLNTKQKLASLTIAEDVILVERMFVNRRLGLIGRYLLISALWIPLLAL